MLPRRARSPGPLRLFNRAGALFHSPVILPAFDIDYDVKVGTSDIALIQTHGTVVSTGLKLLVVGSGGPFAPDALPAASPAVSVDVGIASALASMSSISSGTPTAIPTWIANRLTRADLNNGPLAKYFEHLAHEGTQQAKSVLVEAEQVAEELGLDDELLDELVVAGLKA
jgi:hypothetical protein